MILLEVTEGNETEGEEVDTSQHGEASGKSKE